MEQRANSFLTSCENCTGGSDSHESSNARARVKWFLTISLEQASSKVKGIVWGTGESTQLRKSAFGASPKY